MPVVSMLTRLLDPTYFSKNMTLGDKLYRLRALSEQDYRDLERLVDWKLRVHFARDAHDHHRH
jgi:hypothetical protein